MQLKQQGGNNGHKSGEVYQQKTVIRCFFAVTVNCATEKQIFYLITERFPWV